MQGAGGKAYTQEENYKINVFKNISPFYLSLNEAEKAQNNEKDENATQTAAWIISPVLAMRPCRQGPHKDQDKNY